MLRRLPNLCLESIDVAKTKSAVIPVVLLREDGVVFSLQRDAHFKSWHLCVSDGAHMRGVLPENYGLGSLGVSEQDAAVCVAYAASLGMPPVFHSAAVARLFAYLDGFLRIPGADPEGRKQEFTRVAERLGFGLSWREDGMPVVFYKNQDMGYKDLSEKIRNLWERTANTVWNTAD